MKANRVKEIITMTAATLLTMSMVFQPIVSMAADKNTNTEVTVTSQESVDTGSDNENRFTVNESVTASWTQEDWDCLSKLTIRERAKYIKYLKAEPEVSAMMKESVEESGGYLAGFDSRVKTPHSLYGKLYLRPEHWDIDTVDDTLRYTEIIPEDKYIQCMDTTLRTLIDNGWEITGFWNAWAIKELPYQGLNVSATNADGLIVEIQFHTETSFEVKNSEEDHSLYERRRVLEAGTEEYNEILQQQFKLYEKIEIPEGAEELTVDPYMNVEVMDAAN